MSDQPVTSGMQPQFYFLLRRLHSLSGILPVGVFLMMHLFTNFQLLTGMFQHEVDFIHSMPGLVYIEYTLWFSLGFHCILGLYYTFNGSKSNLKAQPHKGNYRYTLQRITGMLALVFIFFHVATLRWRMEFGGWFTPFYTYYTPEDGGDKIPLAVATTAKALQYSIWVILLYVIGSASIVYHWSNGLWTAAITWGITISEASQKRWGQICAGMAVTLSIFFIGAIIGALNHDVTQQEEKAIQQMKLRAQEPVEKKVSSNNTNAPALVVKKELI